jgi:hypothetical protein
MKKSTENGAKALLKRIEETAFFAHYSLLGDGNIRHYDWEKLSAKMTGLEKGLWQFLLLGQSMTRAEATELLGLPALKFLRRHNLCVASKGKVSMGGVRLVRYWGMSFFIERGAVAASYIGDDAKALLAILPNLTRGRCLSLYTASGLEVMPLVAAAKVQLNFAGPRANENILRANLALNAAEEKPVSWRFSRNGCGSYDLIVSNPPCYFQAPGVTMAKFASAGPDGLKYVRKVLKAASTELAPGGLALTTFAFFAPVEAAAMEQRLRALLDPYGLNYLVAVTSKLLMEPGVPIFNHMISSTVISGEPEVAGVMSKTMEHIRRRQFGAVHLLKARFWKSQSGRTLDRQITNYSDSYYGMWTI